jgi:alpha-L-fucosidase
MKGNPAKYKGTKWIVDTLVYATAKGGNFMVGVGPNGMGSFHSTTVTRSPRFS